MHFPAVSKELAADAQSPAAGELAPGHETILLVEDEDAVRVIVGAVLRRSGYRVLEASTPRAACEMFDRHIRDIDLLVTDIVMPDMNGPALAQRLVGRRPDLRVLFISGYSDRGTPLDTENPNVGFLSKPFQASVLSARVKNMLAGPAEKAPPAPSGA
jgi:DNA-binding NtrC family response regulator